MESVGTVNEYINTIFNFMAVFDGKLQSGSFLFRGVSNTEYLMVPSILRKKESKYIYLSNTTESGILEKFENEASAYISIDHAKSNYLMYLYWLEYAQHYGVPTRLLDMTTNPLTALYFACKHNSSYDGYVWLLFLPNYIANIKNTSECYKKTLRSSHATQNGNPPSEMDIIFQIVGSIISDNGTKKSECFEFPYPYTPRYLDNRMAAQESRFLIWGSNPNPLEEMLTSDAYIPTSLTDIFKLQDKERRFACKLLIPKASKPELLASLNFLGVNQKSLFPGLDGVGAYVEDFYRNVYRG